MTGILVVRRPALGRESLRHWAFLSDHPINPLTAITQLFNPPFASRSVPAKQLVKMKPNR